MAGEIDAVAELVSTLVAELRANTAALRAAVKSNGELAEEARRLRADLEKVIGVGPSASGAQTGAPPPRRDPVDATAEVAANITEAVVRQIAENWNRRKKKG